MNMGHEEEELLPFKEPVLDINDTKRIDILVSMGYNRSEVEESLRTHKFDDAYASYLLLGRRSTDVSRPRKDLGCQFQKVLGSCSCCYHRVRSMCMALLDIYKKKLSRLHNEQQLLMPTTYLKERLILSTGKKIEPRDESRRAIFL